jgi:alkylmercury lyase
MTTAPLIDAIVELVIAAIPPLDPGDQRIALMLLRELAHGEPVGVAQMGRAAELTESDAAAALGRLPMTFLDEQQRVVAFNGLAVHEMGEHRLHLDARTLSTWCAWDALFLPELLGVQRADVTSRSPVSAAKIALTVTVAGPTDADPEGAVMSALVPDGELGADVIQRFCHFVHFFSSGGEGEPWVSQHPGTFLASILH